MSGRSHPDDRAGQRYTADSPRDYREPAPAHARAAQRVNAAPLAGDDPPASAPRPADPEERITSAMLGTPPALAAAAREAVADALAARGAADVDDALIAATLALALRGRRVPAKPAALSAIARQRLTKSVHRALDELAADAIDPPPASPAPPPPPDPEPETSAMPITTPSRPAPLATQPAPTPGACPGGQPGPFAAPRPRMPPPAAPSTAHSITSALARAALLETLAALDSHPHALTVLLDYRRGRLRLDVDHAHDAASGEPSGADAVTLRERVGLPAEQTS